MSSPHVINPSASAVALPTAASQLGCSEQYSRITSSPGGDADMVDPTDLNALRDICRLIGAASSERQLPCSSDCVSSGQTDVINTGMPSAPTVAPALNDTLSPKKKNRKRKKKGTRNAYSDSEALEPPAKRQKIDHDPIVANPIMIPDSKVVCPLCREKIEAVEAYPHLKFVCIAAYEKKLIPPHVVTMMDRSSVTPRAHEFHQRANHNNKERSPSNSAAPVPNVPPTIVVANNALPANNNNIMPQEPQQEGQGLPQADAPPVSVLVPVPLLEGPRNNAASTYSTQKEKCQVQGCSVQNQCGTINSKYAVTIDINGSQVMYCDVKHFASVEFTQVIKTQLTELFATSRLNNDNMTGTAFTCAVSACATQCAGVFRISGRTTNHQANPHKMYCCSIKCIITKLGMLNTSSFKKFVNKGPNN